MAERRITSVDEIVGRRIRERRVALGLTQEQLAEVIGVRYQQFHKYERAINRISAGGLFKVAVLLDTPITYFYEGVEDDVPMKPLAPRQRRLLEMAKNLAEMPDQKHLEAIADVIRLLAEQEGKTRE
jgi:transcriptional regulator with XRE-family HTH domain